MTGVTPETLVLTSEGYQKISSLTGSPFLVWNGFDYTPAVAQKIAEQQKVIRIELVSGTEIECAANFEFRIQRDYYVTAVHNQEAKHLTAGDRLIKGWFPIVTCGDKEFPYSYTHGYYSGAEKFRLGNKVLARSAVYGVRRQSLKLLQLNTELDQKTSLKFLEDMPEDYEIPFDSDYSLETKLEWLAGLFDSGLIKRKVGIRPIWDIYSENLDFLKRLKLFSHTLGGDARVIKNSDLGRAHYTFRLANTWIQNLRKMNIPVVNHTFPEINYTRRSIDYPKISQVIDDYRYSDLYNITQENKDTVVLNGILVPNNSER